jgi:two-component system, NtrC family, response regulator HydG
MEKEQASILVIDDDKDILLSSRIVLSAHFTKIITCQYPEKIDSLLHDSYFNVVLVDMNFKPGDTSGRDGLALLRQIIKISPKSQVIMITAYGDIPLAVEAMKLGAVDFVIKPWENTKLVATVRSAVNLGKSKNEIEKLKTTRGMLSDELEKPFSEIIGKSPAMQEVFKTIEKVSRTDANVLILGENGTGKELVARAIHRRSDRAGEVFISVDPGAIPETLFESELFGHKKGAFTNAKESRTGRLEAATGGTLFLDEIGNLPAALQSKLLTVLQNREIVPLGSNSPQKIDIRLICATNMPLKKMVEEGKFRQDLLYRINTVEIQLPPLRERNGDVKILAHHFLNEYKRKYKKIGLRFSSETLNFLEKCSWPGNVRELQHMVERAVILCESAIISPALFPREFTAGTRTDRQLNLDELERTAIVSAIQKHRGNISNAARELGLGRTTIYRKIQKYGL